MSLRSVCVPDSCAVEGHFVDCRIMGPYENEVDVVSVSLDGSVVNVALCDCAGPRWYLPKQPGHEARINPAAVQAQAVFWRLVDAAAMLRVWLPAPVGRKNRRQWGTSIAAGSTHPGDIFLSPMTTLGRELVAAGVCHRPNRLDRYTLRAAG